MVVYEILISLKTINCLVLDNNDPDELYYKKGFSEFFISHPELKDSFYDLSVICLNRHKTQLTVVALMKEALSDE